MKYIISESRLDGVIDAYLDSQLEPHEIAEFKVPHKKTKKKYWIVDNIVVGEFEEEKFWIEEDIFKGLKNFFMLSEADTFKQIKRYLLENYNVKFLNVIDYRFSKLEQEWYDTYGKK